MFGKNIIQIKNYFKTIINIKEFAEKKDRIYDYN